MWVFAFLIVQIVQSSYGEQILTLGSYSNSNAHPGWATTSVFDNPPVNVLQPINFTTSLINVIVVGRSLVVSGSFDTWGENDDSLFGLLKYDLDTGKWSPAVRSALAEGSPGIVPISDTQFLATYEYSYATCTIGESCTQLLAPQPIAEVADVINVGGSVYFSYYNSTYGTIADINWNPILVVDNTNLDIAVFQGNLIALSLPFNSSTIATFNVRNTIIWNGECWSNGPVLSDWVSNLYNDQNGKILCGVDIFGTTTECFWEDLENATFPFGIEGVFNGNIIIMGNQTDELDERFLAFIQRNGDYQLKNFTSTSLVWSASWGYAVNGSSLYSIWIQGPNIYMNEYNTEGDITIHSTLPSVYRGYGSASTVCALNSYIYISSDEIITNKSASETTPPAIFWNGESWINALFPPYQSVQGLWFCYLSNNYLYLSATWTSVVTYKLSLPNLEVDKLLNFNMSSTDDVSGISVVDDRYIFYIFPGHVNYYDMITEETVVLLLGSSVNPAILGRDGIVYIGGQYKTKDGVSGNLFKYNLNTKEWMTIDEPDNYVYSIQFVGENIYICGAFEFVGTTRSPFFAGILPNGTFFDDLNVGFDNFVCDKMRYIDSENALYVNTNNNNFQLWVYLFSEKQWTNLNRFYTSVSSLGSINVAPQPNVHSKLPIWVIPIIILAGLLAILLISVIVIGIYKKHKKRIEYTELAINYEVRDIQTNLNALRNDPDIPKINPDDLIYGKVLGSGAQGLVYQGTYKNQSVAIKSLPHMIDDMVGKFVQEIKILRFLKHKNVLELVGVSITSEGKISLITELMDSDLKSAMKQLNLSDKIRVLKNICKGLIEIHSRNLLHRDIKPANILISQDGRCKIADMGLTRLTLQHQATITQNTGTLMYMAPEVFYSGHYGKPADMYSFGIMAIELINNQHPFHNVEFKFFVEFITLITERKIQAEPPRDCPKELAELCLRCIDYDPIKRPTAEEALEVIKKLSKAYHFK